MHDPIRCMIVDDEPLAVRLLVDYVSKTPGCEVVFHGTSILLAARYLEEKTADLILLDIQMPELTGIQFLKQYSGGSKVILTTAYPEYALDGYQYDVIDYLLKPITYDRFFMAIQKLKRLAAAGEQARNETESLFVKTEHRIHRLSYSSILFIEARRDYVAFHTDDGKIMSLDTLRRLEQILPSQRFVRIHKSFIVNIEKISFLEKSKVVIRGNYLPVGESYKENVSKITKI